MRCFEGTGFFIGLIFAAVEIYRLVRNYRAKSICNCWRWKSGAFM